MIRINLLEKRENEGRAASGKSGSRLGLSMPSLSGLDVIGSILLVLATAGWLGYTTWQKSSQLAEIEAEIRRTDDELERLQKALAKVDEFQAKKTALEKRVELITDLKRRQVVPVQLLDQLSRELPDFLWLELLNEQSGALKLTGKATTYNAVSNFYNNLKDSTYFADVTLGTTRRVPEGVSFQLSCRFVTPKPGTSPESNGVVADARQGG